MKTKLNIKKSSRRFTIISDDVTAAKRKTYDDFMELEFADDLLYIPLKDTIPEISEGVKYDSQYTILFIVHADQVLTGYAAAHVLSAIKHNLFSYVIVYGNGILTLKKSYRILYDDILPGNCTLPYTEVVRRLGNQVLPKNSMVAFISDNDGYMNWLFDNSFGSIEESDGHEEDNEEVESIQTDACLPVRGLPKIFMGWIYRIWYGKKSESTHSDIETPETEFDDSTTESYTKRTAIIKKDNNHTVTYVWIKPNKDLMLADILKDFNTVYLDLMTYYASLVDLVPDYTGAVIRYFLSIKYDQFKKIDDKVRVKLMTNIIKNYMEYARISSTKVCPDSDYVAVDRLDASRTVYINEGEIAFDNIAIISYIYTK